MVDSDKERNETLPKCIDNVFKITEGNIDYLDDFLNSIKTKDSVDVLTPSSEVLSRFQQYVQRFSDYHKHKETASDFFHRNYLAGLVHLLRECVLSHRWSDALKIVDTLGKEGDKMAVILWKAGMTSLITEKKSKDLRLFVRQLCLINKLSFVEVSFDYLLYLLSEGDLDTAKDLLQDLNKSKEKRGDNVEYLRILFRAYIGLIEYLQWKAEITQDTEDDETAIDFISSQLSLGSAQHSSKLKAEKAVHNMSCVRGCHGVWDIFIMKLVEIHEFYEELEEARSLLEEYKTVNPNNLNAHRYLYNFYMKHNREVNEKLQNLKSIIKLDPSNPLAPALYKDLESSEPDAVSILFDYLDFDHCKNDLQAWTLLNAHLSDILKKPKKFQVIMKCWMPRKDWWPSTSLQVDDNIEELAQVKTSVSKTLKKIDKYTSTIEMYNLKL